MIRKEKSSVKDSFPGIELLKLKYLQEPSHKPYNLSKDAEYIALKQAYSWPFLDHFLQILFGNETGGFFLEAGALDGEYLSNTLRLE
ncbi:UNVERIFIED_CONTAM: hypothetical protein GTU68_019451, partial [Idotea baltica]|nr:hypothetical protein [Idotea baltica]